MKKISEILTVKAVLAVVMVFLSVVNSHALKINDILVYAYNSSGVTITTSPRTLVPGDRLRFYVGIGNDAGGNNAGDLSVTLGNEMTFSFRIYGDPSLRSASFVNTVNNAASGGDYLYFEYIIQPSDFGTNGLFLATLTMFDRNPITGTFNFTIDSSNPASDGTWNDSAQFFGEPVIRTNFTDDTADIRMIPCSITTSTNIVNGYVGSIEAFNVIRVLGTATNLTWSFSDASIAQVVSDAIGTSVVPNGSNLAMPFSPFSLFVKGLKQGTTTMRIVPNGIDALAVEVEILIGMPAASYFVTPSTNLVEVGENVSNVTGVPITITLGHAPTGTVELAITGYVPNRIEVSTNLLTFVPGQQYAIFYIKPLDGGEVANLTFTDKAGLFLTTVLPVFVNNVPPTVASFSGPESVPLLGVAEFFARATDPANSNTVTNDVLTYFWNFGDSTPSSSINGVNLTNVSHVYQKAGTYTVSLIVYDDDGGASVTKDWKITVDKGVMIVAEPWKIGTLRGLGTGTFEYLFPSSVVWDPFGNIFTLIEAMQGIKIRAIPDPGTYPFGWLADFGIDQAKMMVPNTSSENLNALIQTDQALTVYYLFSKEYQEGDGFGDIDGDGLGDAWEGEYFTSGASQEVRSLGLGIATGDYGPNGNIPEDYLPQAGTDNERLNVERTNGLDTVFVFDYPLEWNSEWSGYHPSEDNPFKNYMRFRGLDERRYDATGGARKVTAYVDLDERGNCPGVNPMMKDTNKNSVPDGWQYYFWSTIWHEVHTENWRAHDPTFRMYDEKDIRRSGIPLLKKNGGNPIWHTNTVSVAFANGMSFGKVFTCSILPGSVEIDFTGDGVADYTDFYADKYIVDSSHNIVGKISYVTGEWSIDFRNPLGTSAVVIYQEYNGRYTKEQLLAMFDPIGTNDPKADPDGDGLFFRDEYLLGTNPLHWSTTFDGMPDGWKVQMGLDPLEGDTNPLNPLGPNGNPDGDRMAYMKKTTGYKHAKVYIDGLNRFWNGKEAVGFDPRVGWNDSLLVDEHKRNEYYDYPFTNVEEFRIAGYYVEMGYIDEITSKNWHEYTTNPLDNDTDNDGMPDGWELYVGLDPSRWVAGSRDEIATMAGFAFIGVDDDDGLTWREEFSCVEAANIRAATEIVAFEVNDKTITARKKAFPHLFPEWTNKLLPTDPWNADTDGDGISDYMEYRESEDFNNDGSTLVNLNPSSADTIGDFLPDGWRLVHGLQITNGVFNVISSLTGPLGDPDGDGLMNYQEYLTGAVYGWRYDKWYDLQDPEYWVYDIGDTNPVTRAPRPYDVADFFRPKTNEVWMGLMKVFVENAIEDFDLIGEFADYEDDEQRAIALLNSGKITDPISLADLSAYCKNLVDAPFSYGLQPFSWDVAHAENRKKPCTFLDYSYTLYYVDLTITAEDGYVRNPANYFYSVYPTTSPRNPSTVQDGMNDYWKTFHVLNPLYDGSRSIKMNTNTMERVVTFSPSTDLSVSFSELEGLGPWRRPRVDPDSGKMFTPVAEAYPYDMVNYPWLSGSPFADLDEDGLTNADEAINPLTGDTRYHTDPTPYWMKDPFYPKSHVSLYYKLSPEMISKHWFWNDSKLGGGGAPSGYLFSFNINEGYDTDNDNIYDRDELIESDLRAPTDPLDFDDPRNRKAMYFDGVDSYLRTRNGVSHDKWALNSYTVEFWVRPENPVGHGVQTLIERPVWAPIDDKTGMIEYVARRTFCIQIDNEGILRVTFDNDALETATMQPPASNGKLSPNKWYHVAVTMDSVNNVLKLYLDKDNIRSLSTALKPCTGFFAGWQGVNYNEDGSVSSSEVLWLYPAPLVIGATENAPNSIIQAPYLNDELPPSTPSNFFNGWIGEVRVWDRVRTQLQISQDYDKRYTLSKVKRINNARKDWNAENMVLATMESDFPQEVLYHFAFGNIPDIIVDSSRDSVLGQEIPRSDTQQNPIGFSFRSARVPDGYNGIDWWRDAPTRSRIYTADFGWIPIVKNTAAHMPLYPPADFKNLSPVFYGGYGNLYGWQWNLDLPWAESIGGNPTYPRNTNAVIDVTATIIPNSANPYGFVYKSSYCAEYERHPATLRQAISRESNYSDIAVFPDLLLLGGAVVDMDVEMWDGWGPGWDFTAVDTDGDGLPDWWEVLWGLNPYDSTGDNGAWGDPSRCGLSNYAKFLAGLDPLSSDTDGDGVSDYYARPDQWSLTYGEMYDNGSGIPSLWELAYGLNPSKYTAHEDTDLDGWTNWEEYLAGTRPNNHMDYPDPEKRFTVIYDSETLLTNVSTIVVQSYSERSSTERMDGNPDGLFKFINGIRWSGYLPDATGIYLFTGMIKSDPIAIDTFYQDADGNEVQESFVITKTNDEVGQGDNGRLYINYAKGILLYDAKFIGRWVDFTYWYYFSFPVVLEDGITVPNTHLWGGYNRFCTYIDKNGNGFFDTGEPFGLSVNMPSWVSMNPVSETIAITDDLVGYPRFSWSASTNNVATYYTVTIGGITGPATTIHVRKPRTYLHEGDLLAAGIKGLDFLGAKSATFYYTVSDGNVEIATGSFRWDLGNAPGSGTSNDRRVMSTISPKQREFIYGTLVEFKWKMDHRNSGVKMKIVKVDPATDAELGVYYDDIIALPVRHGKITDSEMYYTVTPQLQQKAFFSLPDGTYKYTITEHVKTTALPMQSITERFQICASPTNAVKSTYSVEGDIRYHGKVHNTVEKARLHTFDGSTDAVSGISQFIIDAKPGTLNFQILKNGITSVESINDGSSSGDLFCDYGSFVRGSVDYKTGEYSLEFMDPLESGSVLVLSYKNFLNKIYVQAFKLPDSATNCMTIGSHPVAQTILYEKGHYKIEGLTKGVYAIQAFIDSNNNGFLDYWETSGMADHDGLGGGAVYDAGEPFKVGEVHDEEEPLIVQRDVVHADIFLRDKDTDNDLAPDAWEWMMFGTLDRSGLEFSQPDLYLYQEYADGPLDSNPNMLDTDYDGIMDAVEIRLTKTNTHHADTDGDKIKDLEELLSFSNPNKSEEAERFKTFEVKFDEDSSPYIVCKHPRLVRGISLLYTLKYKNSLFDTEWRTIYQKRVEAENEAFAELDEAEFKMKPTENIDGVNWSTGYFKIDVKVDYAHLDGFEFNQ